MAALFAACVAAEQPKPERTKADAIRPASPNWPDVFVHQGCANVFVLRDGPHAILFNLGDGSVLDQLSTIGVTQVDWVLFTEHHREVCQGASRIDRKQTQVAAPRSERTLFENPLRFRKWRPTLNDEYTVHGASYVRPSAVPIQLDQTFAPGDTFRWRGYEILCMETPGHSPGGMSYLLRRGSQTCAFIGGVMHEGARMSNWYDIEWDYGFGKGLDTLTASVQKLIDAKPDCIFPAQGPPIHDASSQLKSYHNKLTAFRPDYLRGYPVNDLTKRTKVDPIIRATAIPQIVQVTPHLYKFSDMLAGKNFAIIISDSGKGLLLDCGLFPETLLNELVKEMQTHLGLTQIDALWINHMHGDHFTLGAALKRQFGTQIWTLDRIVDKVEQPLKYDYCALITSYNPEYEGLKVDRALRDGEVVDWEGLQLHIDWMPGQTEFGNCLWLELDGKRIAFTGDNLFGDPSDPTQNGHEAVVARNSAVFEEGYLLGSRYLRDLKPDIVMGAHNVLMTNPAAFLDRYHAWSKRIIDHYRSLLPDENYEYGFDPFWVSAYPYRVDLQQQRVQEFEITVRNFRDQPQRHRVALRLPPGLQANPAVLEGTVAPKSRERFKITLTAAPDLAPAGTLMIPLDIRLDGKHFGERFDFLVQVHPEPNAEK